MTTSAPHTATSRPTVDDNAPIGSMQILSQSLDVWQGSISDLAGGSSFAFDRFKAVVVSCFSRTPKLMTCTRYSIRQAILAAAELGLEVGGVSGEAYLIPYKNRKKLVVGNQERWVDVEEAQFMAGYKGYLRIAYESGLFRNIFALPIFAADGFDPPARGPNGITWAHRENPFAELEYVEIKAEKTKWEKGQRETVEYMARVPKLKGAYAVAQLLDSRSDDLVKVVPAWRLEEIRLRSKAGLDGPWITDYAEMAAKTALRAAWKQWPKSERMRKLEEHDKELIVPELRREDVASVFQGTTVTVTEQPQASASARKAQSVTERVNAKAEAARAPKTAPPASEPKPEAGPPQPHVEIDPMTGEVVPDERQPGEEG